MFVFTAVNVSGAVISFATNDRDVYDEAITHFKSLKWSIRLQSISPR